MTDTWYLPNSCPSKILKNKQHNLHVMNFRYFEDTDTDLERGQGRCKGKIIPSMNPYFHIQNNHPKYTIILIFTAKLLELYILTNSGVKTDNKLFRNRQKVGTIQYVTIFVRKRTFSSPGLKTLPRKHIKFC